MSDNTRKFKIRQTVVIKANEEEPSLIGRINRISGGGQYTILGEDGVVYYLTEKDISHLIESDLVDAPNQKSGKAEKKSYRIAVAKGKKRARCGGCGEIEDVQSVYLPFVTEIFGLCHECRRLLKDKLEE